jgi:predicted amidohydrolase
LEVIVRVALAQVITGRDTGRNLALVEEYAKQAKEGGAELVVFPEATMRAFGHSLVDIAEPVDGPWAARVRAIAAELDIVIVAGMFTPGTELDDGAPRGTVRKVRNTLLVCGPGVDASYDKIHLFDAFGFEESDTVDAGTTPVTFDLGGLTFGLATCYDIRFPDLFTENADRGAEVNIVCASWGAGPGKVEQWQLLARARAVDSTTIVLACGQGDPATEGMEAKGSAPTGVGHSAVVSPFGEVLKELDGGTGLLFADLDPAVVKDARTKLPVLANRHKF